MKTNSKSFLSTIVLTGVIAFCSLTVNASPVQDKMAPQTSKTQSEKMKMAEKKKMDKKMMDKKMKPKKAEMDKMATDTTSKM